MQFLPFLCSFFLQAIPLWMWPKLKMTAMCQGWNEDFILSTNWSGIFCGFMFFCGIPQHIDVKYAGATCNNMTGCYYRFLHPRFFDGLRLLAGFPFIKDIGKFFVIILTYFPYLTFVKMSSHLLANNTRGSQQLSSRCCSHLFVWIQLLHPFQHLTVTSKRS